MIDIMLIQQSIPALLRGMIATIEITALSCSIGCILGTVFAFGLQSKNKFLYWLTYSYTTLFRGTPMLIQILFASVVLPVIFGFSISRFWTAICVIGLNSAAYISYIIHAGIQSIPKGQTEAAQTLGLSHMQIMRYIILPQAIRTVIPALGNEFITLIKDSSLASIIGVQELTAEGDIILSQTYDAVSTYVAIGLCYLFLTTVLSICVGMIEKRMKAHAAH